MEENKEESPKEEYHEEMSEHHHAMREHRHEMRERCEIIGKRPERVIVKGYMRPDGTSYYVVIPKEIRELFKLKGGEYFVIRAKPWANEITLKIAKFVEEPQP